jgi:tetratricopeptide (TPR) repeat protein
MAGASNQPDSRRLPTAALPIRIAVVAFLVYLLTLNHWFSLDSLMLFARTAGWSWAPDHGQPLTRALLFPFLILPAPWIPIALNILSAASAATVLALLARTVAILPHDILPLQPFKKRQPLAILSTPTAWIPPVLAAIVCGLQLSFWENATSFTGQSIDLLLFAWIIRCLFEFRHDGNEKWLLAAAAATGAGMANNWVLLAYFPVFLLAIFGVKGWAILEPRFLFRMFLCGLAGLSLYLLLPLTQTLFAHADTTFGGLLKAHLKAQRDALPLLQRPLLRLISFSALLPFGLLSIRWRSHTVQVAEDTRFGVTLRRITGHAVHALFFICTFWVAFDPDFAPRSATPGLPALTWYYSSALAFGYCVGYALLFALHRPRAPIGRFSLAGARVLLIAVPVLLLWRNLGELRNTNTPALHGFALQLYSDIPGGKSVVLSDDPLHLLLLRAETTARHVEKEPILLETGLLASPQYQTAMSRQYAGRWPNVRAQPTEAPHTSVASLSSSGPAREAAVKNKTSLGREEEVWARNPDVIGPARVLNLISTLASNEPVLYAHPAFGLFFERFADQPHGFAHILAPRPSQESATPVIAETAAATGEQLWQTRWTSLQRSSLLSPSEPPPAEAARSDSPRSALPALRLVPRPNLPAAFLSLTWSRSLDEWGVQMQRLGHATEAAAWFERALLLNPKNLAARLNLEYNLAFRGGNKARLNLAVVQRQWPDLFARYKTWREVMITDGPVDEPTFLFRTGRVLLQNGNSRQAASAFARSIALAPEWPPPKLFLAESCIELGNFETALQLTDQIEPAAAGGLSPTHDSPDASPFPQDAPPFSPARLLLCRASALLGIGRTNDVIAYIDSCVSRFKDKPDLLNIAADLYGKAGAYSSQLTLLNDLVQRDPTQVQLLARQGFAQLQLTNYEAAVATLTKVLELTPEDQNARLSRAIAHLAVDHLEPARADYQSVLKYDGHCPDALFGLATIAWREHDTNQASRLYSQYLAQAKPKSPQYAMAAERLKELQP